VVVLTLQKIDLTDLETLALAVEDLELKLGCRAAPGSVLPPKFVKAYLDSARSHPEWLGCWAIEDGLIVGSAGFKGAPSDGVVEIGYGVSPDHEGRGVGTAMAGWMKDFAFSHGATTVRAHTLHEGYASQTILKKQGFNLVGPVLEPEDGLVLRWEVSKSEPDA